MPRNLLDHLIDTLVARVTTRDHVFRAFLDVDHDADRYLGVIWPPDMRWVASITKKIARLGIAQ